MQDRSKCYTGLEFHRIRPSVLQDCRFSRSRRETLRVTFGTLFERKSTVTFSPFAYSAHVDKIINHTVSKGKKTNGMREGKAINIVAVHRHVVSNVESLAKRDGS